jgi:hypothetical protein
MFWGAAPGKGCKKEPDGAPPCGALGAGLGFLDAGTTLKNVLTQACARIKGEIARVQDAERALFDPFAHAAPSGETFPQCVVRDNLEYFVRRQERQTSQRERRQQLLQDRTLSLQVSDEVQYAFDRKAAPSRAGRRAQAAAALGGDEDEEKDEEREALRRLQRGKAGSGSSAKQWDRKWLSVLAINEEEKVRAGFAARLHARSKPFAAHVAEKLDWVRGGRRRQSQRLKRLEHILALLQDEQHRELQREMAIFDVKLDPRQRRDLEVRTAKERTETADAVMRLLEDYRLVSGAEVAQYLVAVNETFEQQLEASVVAGSASAAAVLAKARAATAPASLDGPVGRHAEARVPPLAQPARPRAATAGTAALAGRRGGALAAQEAARTAAARIGDIPEEAFKGKPSAANRLPDSRELAFSRSASTNRPGTAASAMSAAPGDTKASASASVDFDASATAAAAGAAAARLRAATVRASAARVRADASDPSVGEALLGEAFPLLDQGQALLALRRRELESRKRVEAMDLGRLLDRSKEVETASMLASASQAGPAAGDHTYDDDFSVAALELVADVEPRGDCSLGSPAGGRSPAGLQPNKRASTAPLRAARSMSRRRPLRFGECPRGERQFGGWGQQMSFEGERILASRGHLSSSSRPPSSQADCLVGHRIDKMPPSLSYSHLFKRGVETATGLRPIALDPDKGS